MRISITCLILAISGHIGFAQWYQQTSGTTKDLKDVVFINENTGVVVGDSGVILRTTNGGTLWSVVPTGFANHLTSVYFVDGENGWVTGRSFEWPENDSAVILRTNNGGIDWNRDASVPAYYLADVCFVDESTGYAVGEKGGGGIISCTTDGGAIWTHTDFLPFGHSSFGGRLTRVHFVDRDTGWVLSGGCGTLMCSSWIFRTTDGGDSWHVQLEAFGRELHDISFTDAQNGIAVGRRGGPSNFDGVAYRTTNGGETWLENPGPPFGMIALVDVFHITRSVAVAWGEMHIIHPADGLFWTTNSGATWEFRGGGWETPLIQHSLFFTDTSTGWLVGDGGTIYHTTNGGVTFIEQDGEGKVPTVFSLSQNYPNPFNPSTTIQYTLTQRSIVTLVVYDALGQQVATLVDKVQEAGRREVVFHGDGLSSGMYVYRLQAGNLTAVGKLVLQK